MNRVDVADMKRSLPKGCPGVSSLPVETRPEFTLIEWIAQQAGARSEVKLGIGDDAAVLAASGQEWVVTTDVLTSGVHFLAETPLRLVGRKAMAVNLSDLAAMGAEPCAAFVGIVLPRSYTREQSEQLYSGLFAMAHEFNVVIAGGDTNSWDGPLVISVTLHGLVPEGQAICRQGARPGDWIFVTGALGGSFPSQRHLTFLPRVQEALILRNCVPLHAMLDLSDGLGSDLFHLLQRSQVGAVLDAAAIPIHPDVPAELNPEERLQHALGDGEDFELLFCVSPESGTRLLEQPVISIPLTKIGEITARRQVLMQTRDGNRPLFRSGWSHPLGTSAVSPRSVPAPEIIPDVSG